MRRTALLVLLFGAVPLLGVLDYAADLELDIGVLFLVPVLLVSGLLGRRAGLLMAGGCGATTTVVELLHASRLVHPITPWWNGLAAFLILGAVAWLSMALRDAASREHAAARSDSLTRVANRRLFIERLASEIQHCRDTGQPFSVAYVDCDGFKRINDQLGHQAGDRVLQTLAELMQQNVRRRDTVARLGGDEFALLLSEAGEAEARTTVARILQTVSAAEIVSEPGAVSLSAGVATYHSARSTDEVLVRADRLLFEAKRSGKHRAVFRTFP